MAAPPEILHEGDKSYYCPPTDTINLPRAESFRSPDEYCATLLHELVHATGAAQRLNRKGVTSLASFGMMQYTREELIAELGAALLCGHFGIAPRLPDAPAEYAQGWAARISSDPPLLVRAGAQAQRAVDYILGRSRDGEKP